MQLLEDFKKDVSDLIEGKADAGLNGLVQMFRRAKEDFRQDIFDQAPIFKPFGRSKTPTRAVHDQADTVSANGGDMELLEPTRRQEPSKVFYLEDVKKMASE